MILYYTIKLICWEAFIAQEKMNIGNYGWSSASFYIYAYFLHYALQGIILL